MHDSYVLIPCVSLVGTGSGDVVVIETAISVAIIMTHWSGGTGMPVVAVFVITMVVVSGDRFGILLLAIVWVPLLVI